MFQRIAHTLVSLSVFMILSAASRQAVQASEDDRAARAMAKATIVGALGVKIAGKTTVKLRDASVRLPKNYSLDKKRFP